MLNSQLNSQLNSKAQSPLADALISILRAQLRATSDALAASVWGWSMWAQMLKAKPAMDEQPMAARSPWPHPRIAWSTPWLMPSSMPFGSMLWSMSDRPSPGLGGSCDVSRFGFVPFPPIWWTALGRACWAPFADARAWTAGPPRHPIPAPPPAVHAGLGPDRGFNAGRDTNFASYRSAGGHAVAQVIVKPTEELAQATARAWLSPLEALLGLWRATLGV
jgi:hypothetical protein